MQPISTTSVSTTMSKKAAAPIDELLRLLDGLERRGLVAGSVSYGDIEVRFGPARPSALTPSAAHELIPDVTAAAPGGPRTYLGQAIRELSAKRAARVREETES